MWDVAWLAVCAAVSVGWQPMPGGGAGYECIVHVDAGTAATLDDASLEAFASDVPADIAPLYGVRKVVSAEPAPRRRQMTLLKPIVEDPIAHADSTEPAPEGRFRDGVRLTQFNEPSRYAAPLAEYGAQGDRYPRMAPVPPSATEGSTAWNADNATPFAAVPGQILDNAASTVNQAGERLRTAGQTMVDATANTLRQAGSAVTPSSQELFGGGGSSWNDDVRRAAQNAAAPVRDGFQRLDNDVRGAASNLGARTQGLMNELTGAAPANQNTDPASRYGAAPQYSGGGAGTSATGVAPATSQQWNGQGPPAVGAVQPQAQSTSPYTPTGVPSNGAALGEREWNGAAAGVNLSAEQPDRVDARLDRTIPQDQVGRFPESNGAGVGNLADSRAAAPTSDPRWAAASDSRPRGGADDRNVAAPLMAPDRPLIEPSISNPNVTLGDGPALGPAAANAHVGTFPAQGSAAEVDRSALAQAADRPLENPQRPVSQPPVTPEVQTSAATSPLPTTPPNTMANQPATADAAGAKLAALFAWVILSGSAAGNLYLFWSYLDVRQKYRALVRKTARAVGSRFSVA